VFVFIAANFWFTRFGQTVMIPKDWVKIGK
jgi:hypothetical protein